MNLSRSLVSAALGAAFTLVAACSSDSSGPSGGDGGTNSGDAAGGAAGATGGGSGASGSSGEGGSLVGGFGGSAAESGTSGVGGMAATAGDAGGGDAEAGADSSMDASADTSSDAPPDAPADVQSDAPCPPGTKRCGACVSITNPTFGCTPSGCDPCVIDGGAAQCIAGLCRLATCNTGSADCDGVEANGCETNLETSTTNCGACGSACVIPHATPGCSGGACTVASCDGGFSDCDGTAPNGCESNVLEDPKNCSVCAMACTAGAGAQPDCNAGACAQMLCPIGLADCNNDSMDGCETNLGLDPNNCVHCGRACDLPNATATCSGSCRVATCDAGWQNCDGNHANGCETDVSKSALHCGECGRACETSGATSARCDAGACFQVCNPGTGDCQHPASPAPDDGCDTTTGTDVNNCGACGNVCSTPTGTPACVGGVCTIADCPMGLGDCDGDIANGCETDLPTSEEHCGACGRACSTDGVAQTSCLSSRCVSGCSAGFGNCTQPLAPAADDGCETDVSSDPMRCGGCSRACSTTNVLSISCESGVCTSTCALGFGNCLTPIGGLPDDGCEKKFDLASTTCGSCDNDCASQGGGGSGLKCSAPISQNCGCAGNDGRCRTGGSGGTCDAGTLTCQCGGAACHPGEACKPGAGGDVCSCNDGPACTGSLVCCETPAGCKDLQTDAASCGACGRSCPAGFVCSAGACVCSGNATCNAGSSGACSAGACTCGVTTCAPGMRCQPSGSCG